MDPDVALGAEPTDETVIQIFGTTKCKGTRAAERFFAERGVKVQRIDLASKGIAKGELARMAKAVGGLGALVEKDSTRARERGLHVLSPSAERLEALILEDAQLLRTPIVSRGAEAAVGIAEESWKRFAAAEKA
jgi:arsenate reductase